MNHNFNNKSNTTIQILKIIDLLFDLNELFIEDYFI